MDYGDDANAAGAASPGMAAAYPSPADSAPMQPPEPFHMEAFVNRMVRLARSSPTSFPLAPSIPMSSWSMTPTSIDFVVPVDDDAGEYGDAYRNGGFGAVGASGAAIASLPKATVTGESRQVARANECAVCLEGYEVGDALRTMPCEHDFHERCIVDWLRVSRMCPLCRFKLPPADDETQESDAEEEDEDGGALTC